MEFAYDLTGSKEIIRDCPLYDAASLAQGELLMKGTTDPDSGGDEGRSLVTAYDATKANQAIDAVGILTEAGLTVTTAYSTSTEVTYGKVQINPFAIYKAEYFADAGNDQAITSTTTTTLAIASLADDVDGYWVFFPLTVADQNYALRFLISSGSNEAVMDSALLTTGDSSDTCIFINPPNSLAIDLSDNALGLSFSGNAAIPDGSCATNLRVLDSFIDGNGYAMAPLRSGTHSGLNGLVNAKFYADLCMLDHLYNSE